MFGYLRLSSLIVLTASVLLAACTKKADINSEIGALQQAFPKSQTALAAQSAPGSEPPASLPTPKTDAEACVNIALSAVRSNNYVLSITSLEMAKEMPNVSAQQLMAIQKTVEAITGDLVSRASRGDEKAKADLSAIEKTRSQ